MLCLAFFSPSSSFLSPSSSSSFFPNLILSTRLIELTKPQKFKGKRAGISRWGRAGRPPGALGEVWKRISPLNTLRGTHSHPPSRVTTYTHQEAQAGHPRGDSPGARTPQGCDRGPLVPACHACAHLDFARSHTLSQSVSESLPGASDSLRPRGLYSPWKSSGQNTGVGSLSLLQGIFSTQGSNPGLPHDRRILYPLSHQGSPRILEWVAYLPLDALIPTPPPGTSLGPLQPARCSPRSGVHPSGTPECSGTHTHTRTPLHTHRHP